MSDEKKYIFKINAYTPKTIPMARLAEYMAELSNLLGEKDKVHFEELVTASTGLKYNIESEGEQKVLERIRLVHSNDGPADAMAAYKSLNKKLKEDNGYAAILQDGATAQIIAFPGIKELEPPVFGPITQSGIIDGVVIRIGGKNDPVFVTVQTRDGVEANCRTRKSTAKELGPYIFSQEMRFSGNAKWTRDETGTWILKDFFITGFEQFNERSLVETIGDLRNVKGSGWSKISDPWNELDNIRDDD